MSDAALSRLHAEKAAIDAVDPRERHRHLSADRMQEFVATLAAHESSAFVTASERDRFRAQSNQDRNDRPQAHLRPLELKWPTADHPLLVDQIKKRPQLCPNREAENIPPMP